MDYTKEGLHIIHPSGINQTLTLADLNAEMDVQFKAEKAADKTIKEIKDMIKNLEAVQNA